MSPSHPSFSGQSSMEELLICAHLYHDSSPEDLRERLRGDEVGTLHYAAKIAGPTRAEAEEMLFQNQLASLSRYGAPLKCLNLNPFVNEVKLDDGSEYYATQFDIFTPHAANKLWGILHVGKALNAFGEWLKSADAALEKPTNRECDLLRRCVKEAAFVVDMRADSTGDERKKLPPQPKLVGPEAYQKEGDRQLALDAVAQRIITAALNNEKIPLLKHIAEDVAEKGVWKQSIRTFQNILSQTPPIQRLLEKAKERPANPKSAKYRKWQENFLEFAQHFFAAVLQRSDEGLTDESRTTRISKTTGEVVSELDDNKKKDENGKPTNPSTT